MAYVSFGAGTETTNQLSMLSAKINLYPNKNDFKSLEDWSYTITYQAQRIWHIADVTGPINFSTTRQTETLISASMNGTDNEIEMDGDTDWLMTNYGISQYNGQGSEMGMVHTTHSYTTPRLVYPDLDVTDTAPAKLINVTSESQCPVSLISCSAETQSREGNKDGPETSNILLGKDVARLVVEEKHYNVSEIDGFWEVLPFTTLVTCFLNGGTALNVTRGTGYTKWIMTSQELTPTGAPGSLTMSDRREYVAFNAWSI